MSALDAGHLEQVTRTYIATFAGRADAYVQAVLTALAPWYAPAAQRE